MDMSNHEFTVKYSTDSDFKAFVDRTNDEDVLMEFAYMLYMQYGKNTVDVVGKYVNGRILNKEKIIKYFEDEGKYEYCTNLKNI